MYINTCFGVKANRLLLIIPAIRWKDRVQIVQCKIFHNISLSTQIKKQLKSELECC